MTMSKAVAAAATWLTSCRSWKLNLLLLIAGGLNVFAFEPYGFWQIQTLGLALLFIVLLAPAPEQQSYRRVMLQSGLYSFAWLTTSISWLVIAMSRYGGMPWPLAVLALIVLTLFLSLYSAAFAALSLYLRRRFALSRLQVLLSIFPAVWMLTEWCKGWMFTGFPWAIAGYAHTNSPLAAYAPVAGVYGLSLLAAMLAALLATTLLPAVSRRTRWAALAGIAVLLLSGAALHEVRWTQPLGNTLQVRLLQGNVDQDLKFQQERLNDSLRLYFDMITAAPADLIATPETALPTLSSMLPEDYLPRINAFAQQSGSTVLLGLGVQDAADKYSNSLLGFSPQYNARAYRYDKHHLLPFGEFIPFGFRWFVKLMHIPIGDFSGAGLYQMPMAVKDQFVMPDICYESLFGEEIAEQIRVRHAASEAVPSILLNVSNLAWYGDSIAMPQHLQFAQMRVLETGRPLISATNTGATVIIDASARVRQQLPYQQQAVLQGAVQGMQGVTPYIQFGNGLALGVALLLILLAVVARRRGH